MSIHRSPWVGILLVAASGLAALAVATRDLWLGPSSVDPAGELHPTGSPPNVLKLSAQARKNLGLVTGPVKAQTYWRTIQVPGVVIDRPGLSDRGVTAPAVGVVTQVHAFPGDVVRPGDRLFTLRLNSEYLQHTQSELFKATRETELVREQRARLEGFVKGGSVSEVRLIELDNQLRRLAAAIQAYRQDLLTRGLTVAQIDGVTAGKFVAEIELPAPPPLVSPLPDAAPPADDAPAYEIQELKAELGQQVQAGQLLATLANHHALYVEGHSFRREATYLEQAVRHHWPVRLEVAEEEDQGWPPLQQPLFIHHLANTVDPASRNLDFFVPLTNQARQYQKDGRPYLVWRFRPGQRVRLHIPVEEWKQVLVLPAAAVVREGPEAYVFVQNGDLFERLPVHVRHADRLHVVLADDGSLAPGMHLAHNAAAALNRVLKAQQASGGLPPGAHFHADGSLHVPGQ